MYRSNSITLTAVLASAAMAASAQYASSQDAQMGVSNPPEAMTVEPPAPKVVIPKLAPAPVQTTTPPVRPAVSETDTYTTSAPTYTATTPAIAPSSLHSEDDSIVTAVTPATPTLKTRAEIHDEDAMIVTSVPAAPNELPTGTVLRVRFNQALATDKTVPGSTLLGELVDNIERDGRVLVPAGSTLTASVTSVRGGKRIHGAAMIHIEPRSFTLPDGTTLPIHASLIDTDHYDKTRVDNEGNLIRRDHAKETLAALSLTTGGAAAAGGMMGGVPGALIGAGVGAGVSTVWWLKQDRQMHIGSGSTMVFELTSPVWIGDGKMNGAE